MTTRHGQYSVNKILASAPSSLTKLCTQSIYEIFHRNVSHNNNDNNNNLSLLKEYKRLKISTVKSSHNVTFIERCLRNKVIPHFMTLNLPPSLRTCDDILRPGQLKSLRKVLASNQQRHVLSVSEFNKFCDSIEKDMLNIFEQLTYSHMLALNNAIKMRHDNKFELLKSESDSVNVAVSDSGVRKVQIGGVTINNSSCNLSSDEDMVLNLGMCMAWPFNPDPINCQTSAESMFRSLCMKVTNACDNDNLKTKIKSITNMLSGRNRKPLKIVTRLKNAAKRLGKNKSLYIAKFDKGNGVHIDDHNKYVTKMNTILADTTKFKEYKLHGNAKNHPVIIEEDKFNRSLQQLRKIGKIDDAILSRVRSTGAQPARLYGLAKVHKSKSDPPYRPILSMTRSYKTNLAKWLDNLLKPFIPKEYNIKDSFSFVNELHNINIDTNQHILVSLDVVSLFTNIPVPLTIQHIMSLVDDSKLPIESGTLRRLLFLACSNMLFSFNDKFYVQTDGMCMGSPLGPTMAAFAMDMVECKLNECKIKPVFYRRYVDDIFAIFNTHTDAGHFLHFMNSIIPQLKFTMEYENGKSLTFLDVNVTRENGKFTTDWYCKLTNTGRYIPSISYSPPRYQKAACRCLLYRAKNICSNKCLYDKAVRQIKDMFVRNGYSTTWFNNIQQSVDNQQQILSQSGLPSHSSMSSIKYIFWRIPFVLDRYPQFKKQLQQLNAMLPSSVKVLPVYETQKSSLFFPNKDVVPTALTSSIVYRFKCGHCEKCYIGETVRHFVSRVKEHIKGKPDASEVFMHEHAVCEDDFKIIARSRCTKIAEALHIRAAKRNMTLLNKQGKSLPLLLYN